MDRRTFLTIPLAAAALAGCTPDTTPDPPTPNPTTPDRPTLHWPPGARKGVGMSDLKEFGFEQLNALDVNWFYTWGATYPAIQAGVRPEAEFVPMIWGPETLKEDSVQAVRSELQFTRAAELLGFNEPDHEEQADMSVSAAIKLWPQLEESGLRLGSPAPVQALGDWLKRFMDDAAREDLRVDFVAMHSYAPPNADSFLDSVQQLHDLYGKPIWITEYAVADWEAKSSSPSRYSEAEILAFMRETAVGLREMPFVERFAWKTRAHDDPIMGASALLRSDGSLSPAGELYQSL